MTKGTILAAFVLSALAGIVSEALVGGGDLHPYATFPAIVITFLFFLAILRGINSTKPSRR